MGHLGINLKSCLGHFGDHFRTFFLQMFKICFVHRQSSFLIEARCFLSAITYYIIWKELLIQELPRPTARCAPNAWCMNGFLPCICMSMKTLILSERGKENPHNKDQHLKNLRFSSVPAAKPLRASILSERGIGKSCPRACKD